MLILETQMAKKGRKSYEQYENNTKFRDVDSEKVVFDEILSPKCVHEILPMTNKAANTVISGRKVLKNIIDRYDPRLVVVVGPCSIHDPIAGFEYAKRLKKLSDELSDTLYIMMRVYFEKPRTSIGWKGFINDPFMDGTSRIEVGIKQARQFLLAVNEIGLPVATEILDPNSPRYFGDLLSWTAIGARTAESQIHREMASGLQTPVGFKNGTDGSLGVAVNGILSASKAHSFIGINDNGYSSVVRTKGNAYGHLVLRGSSSQPNYDEANISIAESMLEKAKLAKNIMVDCSHGNSSKNYKLQESVLSNIVKQIHNGNHSIIGVMLESNLESGNQEIPKDLSELKYGCSVTDACIDWDTTERILRKAHHDLKDELPNRKAKYLRNLKC